MDNAPRQGTLGQAQADDTKFAWAGEIRRQIERLLARGWPGSARFQSSIRVGSGSATMAAFDGLDGPILSDGAAAAFVGSDRANNTRTFAWYQNDTVRLNTSTSGDVWLVDKTTGLIAQDAFTVLAAGVNITLNTAAHPSSGTKIIKPIGMGYIDVSLTTTAAIAASATLATVTAAHRPGTNFVPLAWRRNSGGVFTSAPGFLLTSGVVACDIALANGDVLQTTAVYAL